MENKVRPASRVIYHPVAVRVGVDGQFTAHPLGIPEIRGVGRTEQEALEQARQELASWVGLIHWVAVEVASPPANPLQPFAGHAHDDPDFDAYLQEINRGREEADRRECSSISSTPTT
jgi:hypothetical protein